MYDYKALKKIIITLGVAFGVALVVLVATSLPLNGFAALSALFMVAIAAYLILVPLRLLKEMQELERMADSFRQAARKATQTTNNNEQTK